MNNSNFLYPIIIILLFQIIWSLNNGLLAQNNNENPAEILNEVSKKYVSYQSLKTEFECKVFINGKTTESYRGLYYKNGKNIYQKVKDTETVILDEFTLYIENTEKEMRVFPKSEVSFSISEFEILNKYLNDKNPNRIKLIKDNSYSGNVIDVQVFHDGIQKIRYYIDTQKSLIDRMKIYYDEMVEYDEIQKMVVDISYLSQKTNTYIDKQLFNTANYIEINNKKYNPGKKYATYKVISFFP